MKVIQTTPILMYHWFRAPGAPPSNHAAQLEISPKQFAEQMNYLKENDYQGVSLKDLCAGKQKQVAITFDDGTSDFWTYAKPVLDRYGFKATIFVVTDFVGKESSWERAWGGDVRPLLNWQEITALHQEGFEIGSHGHQHRPFTQLDDEAVQKELINSRTILAERLGSPPKFIAYPKGVFRSRHRQLVKKTGYIGACSVMLSWKDVFFEDAYSWKRITVKGTQSMNAFIRRLKLASKIPLISQ